MAYTRQTQKEKQVERERRPNAKRWSVDEETMPKPSKRRSIDVATTPKPSSKMQSLDEATTPKPSKKRSHDEDSTPKSSSKRPRSYSPESESDYEKDVVSLRNAQRRKKRFNWDAYPQTKDFVDLSSINSIAETPEFFQLLEEATTIYRGEGGLGSLTADHLKNRISNKRFRKPDDQHQHQRVLLPGERISTQPLVDMLTSLQAQIDALLNTISTLRNEKATAEAEVEKLRGMVMRSMGIPPNYQPAYPSFQQQYNNFMPQHPPFGMIPQNFGGLQDPFMHNPYFAPPAAQQHGPYPDMQAYPPQQQVQSTPPVAVPHMQAAPSQQQTHTTTPEEPLPLAPHTTPPEEPTSLVAVPHMQAAPSQQQTHTTTPEEPLPPATHTTPPEEPLPPAPHTTPPEEPLPPAPLAEEPQNPVEQLEHAEETQPEVSDQSQQGPQSPPDVENPEETRPAVSDQPPQSFLNPQPPASVSNGIPSFASVYSMPDPKQIIANIQTRTEAFKKSWRGAGGDGKASQNASVTDEGNGDKDALSDEEGSDSAKGEKSSEEGSDGEGEKNGEEGSDGEGEKSNEELDHQKELERELERLTQEDDGKPYTSIIHGV